MEGVCGATTFLFDTAIVCELPDGHAGVHQEEFPQTNYNGVKVSGIIIVTWEEDTK
jgi:hypothetical protein